MWLLTALAREPFKRPFLIFLLTLGAAYPLLAHFLAIDPLTLPAIYAVVAILIGASWPASRAFYRCGIAALLSYLQARYFIFYPWLFCPGYALTAGLVLFPNSFRVWKWFVVSVMFFISLWGVSVWQQMLVFNDVLPPWLIPAIPGSLLGFSLCCTFFVYRLKKDAVREAYDHYKWNSGSEAHSLAMQVLQTYEQIHGVEREDEVRDFCEKTIHLCHQLQEILVEAGNTDTVRLEEQIHEIEQRITDTKDAIAKRQYEQTLANKKKQKEHHDHLLIQCERIHAQILNYLSSLENIRLAYANSHFKSNGENRDVVQLFLNLVKMQAEAAAENAEAYEKLSAS
jgi:hypothetical protein